jgi:hypothetical protein
MAYHYEKREREGEAAWEVFVDGLLREHEARRRG